MTIRGAVLLTLLCAACGGTKIEDGDECVMNVDPELRGQQLDVPPSDNPTGFISIAQGQGLDGCPYILTATPPLDADGNPNPLLGLYLVIQFGEAMSAAPQAYVDIGRGISMEMHGTSLVVGVINESGQTAKGVNVFISDGTQTNGKPQETDALELGGAPIGPAVLPNATASDKQLIPFYAQEVVLQTTPPPSSAGTFLVVTFWDASGAGISGIYLTPENATQTIQIPTDAKYISTTNNTGGGITSARYIFNLAL